MVVAGTLALGLYGIPALVITATSLVLATALPTDDARPWVWQTAGRLAVGGLAGAHGLAALHATGGLSRN